MADFVKPTTAIKLQFLEGHDLLFVHCVSSEHTLLVPMGYRVFSFECREIHISFLDIYFAYQKNRYFNCLFVSKS